MRNVLLASRQIFLLAFFLIIVGEVQARPIISGISTNEINIDTSFTGAEVLLFGVKSDAGDIVVTVRGPKKNYIVSKKEAFLGVWINQNRLKLHDAYSYHAYLSSEEDSEIRENLLSNLEITKEKINFNYEGKNFDAAEFKIEFINKLEETGLYSTHPGEIEFLDESLFKAFLSFPKQISRGTYIVDIYLVDQGKLLAYQAIPIYVNQVGLSAKINNFAHENSVLYALAAILIAVVAGFLANFVFIKLFK